MNLGARIKLERARSHLGEVRTAINDYLSTQPFRVEHDFDQATGEEIRRLRIETPIPPSIAAVVGDCIHNARAALDHLACDAVMRNGSPLLPQNQFPVANSVETLPQELERRLKGASAATIQFFCGLEPFRGATNELWRLHRLDIEDKHKLLLPSVATQPSFAMTTDLPEGSKFAITSLDMFPRKILANGDELYRFRVCNGEASALDANTHLTFDIAFGQTEFTNGEPMLALLEQFIARVQRTLDAFDRRDCVDL